ncbi:MAG: YhdT family protein [Synergistaceae bacterium]|nr:YhdT family protein [Synergistaceae bacterium]
MAYREDLKTAKKETAIVLGLYVLFFVWWYVTAYGFGNDPSEYRYVFGFPEWFFYSCIAGYAGISILLWIIVRLFFKDLPIDGEETSDD